MGLTIGGGTAYFGSKFGWQSPLLQDSTMKFNRNFLFLNRLTYMPSVELEDAFKLPGLALESQGAAEVQGEEEQNKEKSEVSVASAAQNSQTNIEIGDNNGEVIIIVGDHNEVNTDDLPKPLEGEKGNASGWVEFLKQEEQSMVCRDDSGRTQNISGKFETTSFNTNPDEFTITDNSSGEDHVYKYKKVGVDDKGRPIYTCVSMNGEELDSNQYTLVWKEDGTPELVQYSNQDNYGIGLRKKTSKSTNNTPVTTSSAAVI